MARLDIRLEDYPICGSIVYHNFESSMVVEVKSRQHLNQPLMELKESVIGKLNESLLLGGDGVLRYQ